MPGASDAILGASVALPKVVFVSCTAAGVTELLEEVSGSAGGDVLVLSLRLCEDPPSADGVTKLSFPALGDSVTLVLIAPESLVASSTGVVVVVFPWVSGAAGLAVVPDESFFDVTEPDSGAAVLPVTFSAEDTFPGLWDTDATSLEAGATELFPELPAAEVPSPALGVTVLSSNGLGVEG